MGSPYRFVPQFLLMSQSREIGEAVFNYGARNRTNLYHFGFPAGASSTEVFQKLLDDHDVTDPTIFYVAMLGKVRPVPGRKLRPENVSFDLTVSVDSQDTDDLPLVFLTGYRVTYMPGAAAVPLIKPLPRFGVERPRWWLLGGETVQWQGENGQAVYYKGDKATWLHAQGDSVPNFVPASFDANGKTYQQLTPDGVLPPP
jgi:hypothetical protein